MALLLEKPCWCANLALPTILCTVGMRCSVGAGNVFHPSVSEIVKSRLLKRVGNVRFTGYSSEDSCKLVSIVPGPVGANEIVGVFRNLCWLRAVGLVVAVLIQAWWWLPKLQGSKCMLCCWQSVAGFFEVLNRKWWMVWSWVGRLLLPSRWCNQSQSRVCNRLLRNRCCEIVVVHLKRRHLCKLW